MDEWFMWIIAGLAFMNGARIDVLEGRDGWYQKYRLAIAYVCWIIGLLLMTGIAHD